MKSHRYGMGFEDSQTRKPERLQMLLLIYALALWVMWIVRLAAITHALGTFLKPNASRKTQYSTVRMGKEIILRGCVGLLLNPFALSKIPPDSIPPPIEERK